MSKEHYENWIDILQMRKQGYGLSSQDNHQGESGGSPYGSLKRREFFMNLINDEKDTRTIEELVATNRLLTDLTEAGSWTINFAPDGSVASVQWGDGLRRLLGYTDLHDFPNELESFMRGIHPEDRDTFIGGISASIHDENIMRTTGFDCRYVKKDGSVRWFRSKGMLNRDSEGKLLQYRG